MSLGHWRNPLGIVGAAIIAVTVLMALLGHLVWTIDDTDQAAGRLEGPSLDHPLGTDQLGRDTLARIIGGASVSLHVGIVAVGIALVAGVLVGVAAGLQRGWLDAALMRVMDIMFALPALVLAIVIAGMLGPSRTNAMIAIGIVYTPAFARVVRGAVLAIMELPYVEAARALGTRRRRIVTRHLLPNILPLVLVLTTTYLSTAILSEAALSFLGLGVQPPQPSWGSMLSESRKYMTITAWVAVFPGAAIMLVVLGFNLLGDGLRDILDPRLRDIR
jgi:peptide/nickel transport system permease protein